MTDTITVKREDLQNALEALIENNPVCAYARLRKILATEELPAPPVSPWADLADRITEEKAIRLDNRAKGIIQTMIDVAIAEHDAERGSHLDAERRWEKALDMHIQGAHTPLALAQVMSAAVKERVKAEHGDPRLRVTETPDDAH